MTPRDAASGLDAIYDIARGCVFSDCAALTTAEHVRAEAQLCIVFAARSRIDPVAAPVEIAMVAEAKQ